MCVCYKHPGTHRGCRPEKGGGFLGARNIGGCELPDMAVKSLTSETSLQLQGDIFKKKQSNKTFP